VFLGGGGAIRRGVAKEKRVEITTCQTQTIHTASVGFWGKGGKFQKEAISVKLELVVAWALGKERTRSYGARKKSKGGISSDRMPAKPKKPLGEAGGQRG